MKFKITQVDNEWTQENNTGKKCEVQQREIIEKKQTKILELKNTINEIKKSNKELQQQAQSSKRKNLWTWRHLLITSQRRKKKLEW